MPNYAHGIAPHRLELTPVLLLMVTRHYEVSPVPSTIVLTFRSLYTEEFLSTVSSISVPSMVFVRKPMTRLPFVPEGSKVTMLQDSLYVTDC